MKNSMLLLLATVGQLVFGITSLQQCERIQDFLLAQAEIINVRVEKGAIFSSRISGLSPSDFYLLIEYKSN
jgi:hypothetical protein